MKKFIGFNILNELIFWEWGRGAWINLLLDIDLEVSSIPHQVTRSVDTEAGQLSPQEQRTIDAIVEAR